MKRDMDLIRELMLRLEAYPLKSGMVCHLHAYDEEVAVSGYNPDEIDAHLTMISRSGFVENGDSTPSRGMMFKGLTWRGHDFLDSVRDPDIWSQTKEGAKRAGGFTVDILVALAKGFITQKIKKHTGVEIDL